MSRILVAGLQGVAVVLAAAAQTQARTRPAFSLGAFAAAMGLFLLGCRATARAVEPEVRPSFPPSRVRVLCLLLGCCACFAAGAAVFSGYPPRVTHGCWFAGLALLLASAAWPSGRWRAEAARSRVGALLAALSLVAASVGFFGWHLTTVPPEVHGDEAETGLDAIELVESDRLDLFRTGWFELPIFHAVPTAIGLKLFGINLTGLRATSAVLGAATVLLLFAVARRLWGIEVAFLAGLLLVSQRYFIHLARAGYHYIDTPFLSLLALWLFLSLWYELRWGAAIACGIVLGLGVQTYYASRLVPLLLMATCLLWLVRSERRWSHRRVGLFGVVVLVALATCAPMIAHFWSHWGDLWSRTQETSVFSLSARHHLAAGYGTNDLRAILWLQMKSALSVFNVSGDASIQYGYGQALLEPISAALFTLGVAALMARPADRRGQLALLWLVAPVIIGGALTIDAPFYPRISGAVPFAALAVAVALSALLDGLRRALGSRVPRAVAMLVAVVVLAVIGWNNVTSYFFDYAPRHRHNPGPEIGRWIVEHGRGKTTYMVGGAPGYFIKHGSIRFLTHGYETRDVEDLEAFLTRKRLDAETSLFIIMPGGYSLLPRLAAAVGPLTVEEHRWSRGVEFYTAIPRASP